MNQFMQKLWKAEPVILTLLGSAAFWPSVFILLKAFGHPLTSDQENAVTGLAVMIAGAIIRSQVTPNDKS